MAKQNRLRVTIFSRLLSQKPRPSIRRILELFWNYPGRILDGSWADPVPGTAAHENTTRTLRYRSREPDTHEPESDAIRGLTQSQPRTLMTDGQTVGRTAGLASLEADGWRGSLRSPRLGRTDGGARFARLGPAAVGRRTDGRGSNHSPRLNRRQPRLRLGRLSRLLKFVTFLHCPFPQEGATF